MIPAPLVIFIGLAVCIFLARRFRQLREPEIFWALAVRLYAIAVYFWIALGQGDPLQIRPLLRLAWTLLFAVELINHVSRTDFYKRVARRLENLAHAVHRR